MTALDYYLPRPDFREYHQIKVQGEPEVIYQKACAFDFQQSKIIRFLFWLRGLGRVKPVTKVPSDQAIGFVKLADNPPEELVLGMAGEFWHFTPETISLSGEDFRNFAVEGKVKVAVNTLLRPDLSGEGYWLSTETRVAAYGKYAKFRFRLYWCLIKPFSGLIRRIMLKKIKRAC